MIAKRPKTAREVAVFSLFSMQEEGAWSDGALHAYLERAALSARDAALASKLVYGTIQNETLCDFYLRQFSSLRLKKIAPRVLIAMRMAMYQLAFLDRIPPHAAVSESVSLIKAYGHANPKTVSFANAVLRQAADAVQNDALPQLDCPDKESYYALRYSHPEWLVRAWSGQFGQKTAGEICKANNEDTKVSVRVNLQRGTVSAAMEELKSEGFSVDVHPNIEKILLVHGGDVTKTDAFQNGLITVQDAASLVCAEVVGATAGTTVLDCCAAPGGKSFALAEGMDDAGRVIACDIYEHKLEKIAEGASRLGLQNIETVLQDAGEFRSEFDACADFVLCDVPCSGFGIIRKKPEIRWKRDEETANLPSLQAKILQNASRYVKLGGVLVYSTCTILERENEAVVRSFLEQNALFSLEPWSHPVCGKTDGMQTLLPCIHETDGFFIAKMRKQP